MTSQTDVVPSEQRAYEVKQNTVGAFDQELWFFGKGYTITPKGMFHDRETKAGTVTDECHAFGALPIEILEAQDSETGDADETQTFVRVKFISGSGALRFVTIPLYELTDFSRTSRLVKAGWPPPSQTQRGRVGSALLAALSSGVPTKRAFLRTGWVDMQGDDGEAVKVHLRPGHELYAGRGTPYVGQAGTLETWRQTMHEM